MIRDHGETSLTQLENEFDLWEIIRSFLAVYDDMVDVTRKGTLGNIDNMLKESIVTNFIRTLRAHTAQLDSDMSKTADREFVLKISATSLMICALLVFYFNTASSMTAIWLRSDTFMHGIIVFPISLYLIWRRRHKAAQVPLRPSPFGLSLLAALSVVWAMAKLADVLVIQHIAFVAMILAIIWSMLGGRVILVLLFPLVFMIFAVPFGEGLIPYLMQFTAKFTVKALQLSGIPVFHEGLYFSIPGANFEVATACSGIRYLIASLALGTLYAYLTYHSIWRRGVFIILSAIVPIVANGTRAYLIVLIAYFSNNQLAVGVDHIIYGWLFFGVIMFVLFWLGSFFKDKPLVVKPVVQASTTKKESVFAKHSAFVLIGSMTLILLLLGPVVTDWLVLRQAERVNHNPIQLPVARTPWAGPQKTSTSWRPDFKGADEELAGRYDAGDRIVELFIASFHPKHGEAELINSEHRVYDNTNWSRISEKIHTVHLEDDSILNVIVTRIRSDNRDRLVWHWYNVGGHDLINAAVVKLFESWFALKGGQAASILLAVSADDDGEANNANIVLGDFVTSVYADLRRCFLGQNNSFSICVSEANQ